MLVPLQVSVVQASPSSGQAAPALPAGCVQALLVPSHTSLEHGLPSSGHAVPAALLASVGHVAVDPVQFSAGSQIPAEARQIVLEGRKRLGGQVELVPVQFSATSHPPD